MWLLLVIVLLSIAAAIGFSGWYVAVLGNASLIPRWRKTLFAFVFLFCLLWSAIVVLGKLLS